MLKIKDNVDLIEKLNKSNKKEKQEELKSANESITWWQNRFKAVERDKKDYKSRNEKAIKIVKENLMGIGYVEVSKLLDILQGDDKK